MHKRRGSCSSSKPGPKVSSKGGSSDINEDDSTVGTPQKGPNTVEGSWDSNVSSPIINRGRKHRKTVPKLPGTFTSANSFGGMTSEDVPWLGKITEQFNKSPATVLFPTFMIFLVLLFQITHRLPRSFRLAQTAPEVYHTLSSTKFVESIAVILFGINGLLQLSSTMFQRLQKKRQLNSLVLFINIVPFITNLVSIVGILPEFGAADGRPMEYLHVFQWMFTTPCMIIVLSSLGTSMRKSLVFSWPVTLNTIMWDEIMLLSGLLSYIAPEPWHILFYMVACMCFFKTLLHIHGIVEYAIVNSGTSFEARSIKILELLTWALWSTFPLMDLLHLNGFLSFTEHRVCRVLSDVFVKTVYSVAILSGNFCLLDTISEIRLSQMQDAHAETEENVVRTEKLNEALRIQCVEADTTARMAKRFVANLSHELRTPLNSVIAFNSLLLESGLEPIHEEYVKSSLTSAEALLGIIGQVLDYSKLEHSIGQELELTEEKFHMSQVLDEVLDVVVARIASRQCQFLFANQASIPFTMGDKFRIRQALINLADNAVKFSKEGDAVVEVYVYADTPQNDKIMLTIDVKDNGIGIPENKRDLIFKPFSQVYSHLSRKYGGTGLGLVITKKIIEAMDGTINFTSEGGEGTVFRVRLELPIVLDDPVPKHCQAGGPLNGQVWVCLKHGVFSDNLLSHIKYWGLSVVDMRYNDNDMEEKLDSLYSEMTGGDDRVAFTDFSTLGSFFKVEKRRLLAPAMLVIGDFDEQVAAVQQGLAEVQRFVLRPVKPSVLYNKLSEILANPKSRVQTSVGMMAHRSKHMGRTPGIPGPGIQARLEANRTPPRRYASPSPQSINENKELDSFENKEKEDESNWLQVLIVEDHIVNQKVVVAMLNKVLMGKYKHKIANNGQEGLEMATKDGHAFDLILMDIQMPIMDGLAAASAIRQWEEANGTDESNMYYICAITAHASQADRNDCYSAGMNRYATKPLNMSAMNDIIASYRAYAEERGRKSDASRPKCI